MTFEILPKEYWGELCRDCAHFILGEKRSHDCLGCEPECGAGLTYDEMSWAWGTNRCNHWEKKPPRNNGSKK